MNHYSDDDFVLCYYGEADKPLDGGEHLRSCAECGARYREIAEALDGVVLPEAPALTDRYGVELWARLAPQLPTHSPWSWATWVPPRTWAAAAALLVLGFAGGRLWPNSPAPTVSPSREANASPAAAAEGERRRAVLSSVADHLERSDRMLTDVVNAPRDADVSTLQDWAADLVWTNRYYRQDALAVEEPAVAAVLDEVERTLLDFVHGPSRLKQADLDELHRRVDAAALLFKIRILGGALRERGGASPAPASNRPFTSRNS